MKKTIKLIPLALAALLIGAPATAMDNGGHESHDHGAMQASVDQAMGMGTLHSIDAENRMVNLTHAPIPALNWPEMTMDLPVTTRVDLESVAAGDHIHFTLKLGRDDVYRIIEMKTVVMDHDMGGDGGDHAGH